MNFLLGQFIIHMQTNHHVFVTIGAHAIRSNIELPSGRSIFTEITYTQLCYIKTQINFHKRGHIGDMLFQLIHLNIYIYKHTNF